MPELLLRSDLPGLVHRGKVKDTYLLDDETLLLVITDRISAFDVVLPGGVPKKGEILARLSAFWFQKTRDLVPNHLIKLVEDVGELEGSYGRSFPRAFEGRALLVRRAERIPVECIVRGYLAGSAWREYRERGTVWGRKLPPGLREGAKLPEPLFTPTTKEEVEHDRPLTREELSELVGEEVAQKLEERSLEIYSFAERYARERGIIIADTKFEFGRLPDGSLLLIDEALTPDSSRFWPADEYRPGSPPPSFDKQYVRNYLTRLVQAGTWDKQPPGPELPDEVVRNTVAKYRQALVWLTS